MIESAVVAERFAGAGRPGKLHAAARPVVLAQRVERVKNTARLRHILHFNLVVRLIARVKPDRADSALEVLLPERLKTLDVLNRADMH